MSKSPIIAAIDKACGFTPEMQKHMRTEIRRQKLMANVIAALDEYYLNRTRANKGKLMQAWKLVRDETKDTP